MWIETQVARLMERDGYAAGASQDRRPDAQEERKKLEMRHHNMGTPDETERSERKLGAGVRKER